MLMNSSATGAQLYGWVFEECTWQNSTNIDIYPNYPMSWDVVERNCTSDLAEANHLPVSSLTSKYGKHVYNNITYHFNGTYLGKSFPQNTIYKTAAPAIEIQKSSEKRRQQELRVLVGRIKAPASTAITISCWVRKDSSYNGSQPKLVISDPGYVTEKTDSMSVGADTWEQLEISFSSGEIGSSNRVLTVWVEIDGVADAGSVFADDLAVA